MGRLLVHSNAMKNHIPAELENQIRNYEKSFSSSGQTWHHANLEAEMFKYFKRWWEDPSNIDTLFTRFANIWAVYYRSGDFLKADKFWDVPPDYATKWEETHQKHLHKGTPYYFRGMAAIAAGDVDRGFLFFHQVLEEDWKMPSQRGWGPVWSFVTFNR